MADQLDSIPGFQWKLPGVNKKERIAKLRRSPGRDDDHVKILSLLVFNADKKLI